MIPGFVDSHNHLVFAGDRAAEFEARMTGQAYAAGGIRTTVAATRAATDEELLANGAAAGCRGASARARPRSRRRAATGSTSRPRRASCGSRGAHRRDDVPRRARGAGRVRRTVVTSTSPWWPVRCWRRAPRTRAGPTCSSSAVRSTPTRRGPSWRRQRRAVWGFVSTPGSSGRPRASGSPSSSGARERRPLHVPHRRGCRRARRQRYRRDPPAGRRVLHPPAVPGCTAPAGCGRHRRDRHRLQPWAPATPHPCRSASHSPCASCG